VPPSQEATSLIEAIPIWGPILGSLVMNAATIIWGAAKLGSKVDRIEEKLSEKDGELKKLEEKFSLRMTEMEARQAKLEDYMLKEIRSVLDIVQKTNSVVAGIEGYMRAQSEKPHRARR
jgi:hypothetical protein